MSLAMTADGVLVVGSYGNEFLAGSVEVFRYCGGAWNHEKTLVGDDTVPEDWFGSAVDIDGNTVVAGALYNPAGGPSAGTVYVFSFDGTDWHQVDKLVPADSMPGDAFGYAVSIHQDSILVGAIGVDWDWRLGVGAAYFFGKQNGTWVEQQKVQIPNTYGAENFGGGLKLNGNMALIGSSRAYADGNKESVRLWSKCNGHWYMQQKIQPGDLIGSEFFGAGMVLEDQQIIISSLAAVRVYNLEDGLSLESYSFLQRCWSGDNDIIDPGCSSFDFDHNGKIDLLDYSELSTCWINP
jgi:hypothetical protein